MRRAIAAGEHLSTLAFSESGSRSHFWAPLSTATLDGDEVVLDASKSWVTSAGEATSYVWTSRTALGRRPTGATLWLVPADTAGLKVAAPFDGLGLRGNASSPIVADGARVPVTARLGADGAGIDVAFATALPMFQVLNASCSLGLADAAIGAVDRPRHAGPASSTSTRPSPSSPSTRQHIARMKLQADAASTLVDDAVIALGTGRADAPLRMLRPRPSGARPRSR